MGRLSSGGPGALDGLWGGSMGDSCELGGGDWAGVACGRLGASDGCIRRGGGLVIVLGWIGRWVGRGVSPNMVGVR